MPKDDDGEASDGSDASDVEDGDDSPATALKK